MIDRVPRTLTILTCLRDVNVDESACFVQVEEMNISFAFESVPVEAVGSFKTAIRKVAYDNDFLPENIYIESRTSSHVPFCHYAFQRLCIAASVGEKEDVERLITPNGGLLRYQDQKTGQNVLYAVLSNIGGLCGDIVRNQQKLAAVQEIATMLHERGARIERNKKGMHPIAALFFLLPIADTGKAVGYDRHRDEDDGKVARTSIARLIEDLNRRETDISQDRRFDYENIIEQTINYEKTVTENYYPASSALWSTQAYTHIMKKLCINYPEIAEIQEIMAVFEQKTGKSKDEIFADCHTQDITERSLYAPVTTEFINYLYPVHKPGLLMGRGATGPTGGDFSTTVFYGPTGASGMFDVYGRGIGATGAQGPSYRPMTGRGAASQEWQRLEFPS